MEEKTIAGAGKPAEDNAEDNITSKKLLNQLMKEHYSQARTAKAQGRTVVWATSIIPQEILEAMDLTVVYPENHAAAVGARKDAPGFIRRAEQSGYSTDICSYARVNLAYAELPHSEAENIPAPDLIFCGSNICCTVIKWYENLARKFRIPMILMDAPCSTAYYVEQENVTYIRRQIEDAIRQLETVTGRKMDRERLLEVMRISNENAMWWKKATDLLAHRPAPACGFDMFNYMAPIVCLRGKKEGTRLFRLWYDELLAKIGRGEGPWQDQPERYRVLWDGIACWPYLSDTYKILKRCGINVVTSTYPESWTLLYEPGDLDGMARAYGSLYVLRSLNYAVDRLSNLASDFAVDGAIFHSNRSCKGMDFKQYEIARRLRDKYSIPSVFFDGDQTDPNAFSLAQYETRVQALLETMENRREQSRKQSREQSRKGAGTK
ncbi:MAG: 2-hydroxyacyl-CoA dehydratase family protein [Peptococcaceae bacterium]|jgi:benzoyl-CoA reductase/2-hydroxyglutaryl-CoA dehydratase subunit BcrC/BadD/HgdB|nr:2-hydroxyacyl-CoA dehydratase family protein [Peptococcaceae bacterium]